MGVVHLCGAPLASEPLAALDLRHQRVHASPPVRWHAQDAVLSRATEHLIAVLVTHYAAIDAHRRQFVGTEDPASRAIMLFLDTRPQIIAQIHAGPP
jgi:hypothetical protein